MRDIRPGDLRAHGRVLLISCYELGHAPHGLAVPLAFLRRAGFDPRGVDISVEPLADEHIDDACLVAISVPMHTALRLGVRVAGRIKAKNPGARLCFFGHYAPLNRDELHRLGAEWVLGGECEQALVDVAATLDAGDAVDRDRNVVLSKLDFPPPSRGGLAPLDRYARLDTGAGETRVVGYSETSRGCLDHCRHCPLPAVYGGRFFVIPSDVVIADIAAQVALGARHITFGDPDFLNGPGHGMEILREMHRRWPELGFDITAQIMHLSKHRALLPELVELGCAFVISAAESLSDVVLENLGKRHRRADLEEVLALARAAGLVIRPTFVTFTPWTTLDDIRELVDFIVDQELIEHLDPVQLTIRLLVPPGSLLLENPRTRTCFGALEQGTFTHRWQHADPRVDALQRRLAQLVEAAADSHDGRDPAATFLAVRALVYRQAGREAPALSLPPRRRVPRVTEPWFC